MTLSFLIWRHNSSVMKTFLFVQSFIIIAFSSCFINAQNNKGNIQPEIETITFNTSDSVQIHSTLYKLNTAGTTILLFHQGGSNVTAEYKTIIPKLIGQGFNILAVDQRVGGQIYGNYNKTIVDITTNSYGYCDAYPDLEAALNYLINSGFSGKKILWGSSYSASLVIQLANNRSDDVSAVLAFSPASGDQLKDCLPNPYFETIKVPLLVLRPESEAKFESVKEQLKLAQSFGHQTFVATNGVHGSSMLVEERVNNDVSENWNVVNTFLKMINN